MTDLAEGEEDEGEVVGGGEAAEEAGEDGEDAQQEGQDPTGHGDLKDGQ